MTQLILRGLAAGFLVVAVAEIARWWPRVGSLILTLPIVIPVVFLVMYMTDADVRPISRMAREGSEVRSNAVLVKPHGPRER